MALITPEMRALEIKEQQLFEESIEQIESQRAESLKLQPLIASRLMRRHRVTVFETVFRDDRGDFPIQTRQMSSDERSRAMMLTQRLRQLGDNDIEEYNRLVGDFKEFACEILVTPGLEEYLLSEDIGDDVAFALVMNTLNRSMQLVREALTCFRKE